MTFFGKPSNSGQHDITTATKIKHETFSMSHLVNKTTKMLR